MMKKIISIVMILTVSAWLVGPGVAQAITADELQVQIDALMAQLADLQAELAGLTGETPTVAGCTITSFDRNLSVGDTGTDVNCLQIVLNSSSDTQLASSGVGSSGNETSYFGPLTKGGVIKFQEKYASEVLASWGLTSGTGFVGSTTRAKLDTLLTAVAEEEEEEEEEVPPVSSGLGVSLASDTPASTTVITDNSTNNVGQVLVPFTTINFTAASEGSVTVTTLKFTRTGIAADANLDNTYLYEGDAKLVEGGTLSSKVVTFNDASGIFTVPAGGTKSITLKANLNYDVSAGKTIGFSLVSVDDVTSDASAVSGTFPVTGNLMSVANASDLGYLSLTAGSTPGSSDIGINAQDDYEVWRVTVQANNQDVDVEQIIFTEVGSILTDDLQNFELLVGGTVIGTSEMDSNNQVVFDFSDSPYTITKGQSKILKLYADIVKGANKTFKFTIQYPTDVVAKDTNYGVYVASYTGGTWSIIQPSGNYKINAGDLSITKATDSPVGNVARNATTVTLAKYDFKATGEDIKVSNLNVTSDHSGETASTWGLNNGMIYLDGIQVGSTKDIAEYGQTATNFTFGTSFIVAAGTTGVVEIKADVKNRAGTTDSLTVDATITIRIESGTTNAQGRSSLTVLSRPATAKAANALTIKGGSLTFTKLGAYGTQYTVKPSTGFKIGSFQILAGSSEGINVDSITVDFDATETADTENLLLKIGADQIGTTKVTTSTSNLFSVNVDLAASAAKVVDIYSDVLSTATGTTVVADIYGTGTTADTSASVTAYTSGSPLTLQTINITTATLAVAIASDNPDDALVVGMSQDMVMAKYEFSSLYEEFNISEVKVYASSEVDRTAPRYNKPNFPDFFYVWLSYLDSASDTQTTTKRAAFVNGMIHFTGLNMYVPANGTAKLTVYADLNAVAAAGYALPGDRPQISLAYYKANSGSISSFERRTGKLVYAGDGATLSPMTWVADGGALYEETTNGTGSYALNFAVGTQTANDGSELDIPLSDLNLTVADFVTAGDLITFSAYSTVTDTVPMVTLFMDCDQDGSLDGEMLYSPSQTITASTWTNMSYATETKTFDWWSNDTDAAGCDADANSGSGVLMSTMDTDVVILGASFSVWGGSNAAGTYKVDNLVITAGITPVAYVINGVEDDMGDFGTNYILYKSKPTVTLEGAVGATLTVGTKTLYSLNVAADTAGDLGLKAIKFAVTATDSSDVDNLKFYKGNTDYTAKVTINSQIDVGGDDLKSNDLTGGDGAVSDVFVVFTNEEIITGGTSQIYYLKARIGSVDGITSGDGVATYLVAESASTDITRGAAYATGLGNFIWTDRSSASHSQTSTDWINGLLVKTLGDVLTFTLSKL
ncbi:MAG TPA: hypothetical protein ENI19_00625 [Candidatus Nealsonbacteria bacterium]|uniref:Uncharacterized protein n=1 Tax=marine sediment metagenome TaxID=412755 RepID=A0A0F9V9X3_9ZZZZ|nr:hypothetical protein [Candidatus Nealsonbacteria bacterium]HEB46196.1 hypothetical protein [Candidatus Nealsonbacteria bacterium]